MPNWPQEKSVCRKQPTWLTIRFSTIKQRC